MPFETLEDIIRALEQHPEWREPLLKVLELDRLRALPEQVAELRASWEERYAQLESALTRLVEITRQNLEIQRSVLEMLSILVKDVHQLADKVDRLDEKYTALEQKIDEKYTALEQKYESLDERVARLEAQYAKLVDDVGSLKGMVLELKYRDRAAAFFGRYLRKVRLLSVDELIETLEAIKPLTEAELDEVLRADAVFTAVRATTREPLYLVLEISYVVDRVDVSRAIQRARVLQERGLRAVPAVAGEQATEGAKSAAKRGEVVLALDGTVYGTYFERSL